MLKWKADEQLDTLIINCDDCKIKMDLIKRYEGYTIFETQYYYRCSQCNKITQIRLIIIDDYRDVINPLTKKGFTLKEVLELEDAN